MVSGDMKHLIIVLSLLSTCCAHSTKKAPYARSGSDAPAWGAYSYQCVQTREVVCLVDNDFTEQQCNDAVVPAIKAINETAGQPLFHYLGARPFDMALGHSLVMGGVYVIIGSQMQEGILGETRTRFDENPYHPHCIQAVMTALLPSIWTNPNFARGVVLHEMLHALGAAHADPHARYESNMMPSANHPHWKNAMTPSDAAALRAMYPKR